MDTELLKTFLELEKTRHFGRAADNLYLTQAAVSSRIRQLESLLGTVLFTRYRNNISLTPAGERLKPQAAAVLAAWNRAVQEAALAASQSTQFAIGGTPNLWDTLLQNYLQLIYRRFPEFALRAEALNREACTQHLLARSLDLAVLFDPPKVDELKVDHLAEIQLSLVSAYDNVQLDDVFGRGYVQVDWGTSFNIQHARLAKAIPTPVLHTSTARIALDFILDNGGSAFLPEAVVQPYLDSGQLFRIADVNPITRTVYAVYLQRGDKREMVNRVLSTIADGSSVAAAL